MESYQTFFVKAQDGRDVEMAIVDEFEFGGRHYVASSVVEDDTIDADAVYLYRCNLKEDDFIPERITSVKEYNDVSEAYLALCAEEAEGEEN